MLHQRFEKHIDMIETPLRSMVNYAVWIPHNWALCFHDYHHWTIKRLHNYSLCLTIPDSSKVRSPVSPYLVSTLLPMNPVYLFRVIATSCACHAPAGLWSQFHRVGPRVSILHMDGQIPLLINLINLLLPGTQDTPLWSPCYGATVNVLKAPFRWQW